MDPDWLAAANEAIDSNADRISHGLSGAGGKSRRLAGRHRDSMSDPWELPEPYCEPFRRMIAHPALIRRLNWIMGSGFECRQCSLFAHRKGGVGHYLHSGTAAPNVGNHYRLRNGRAYCEYVNVAWQLRDVTAADGGFCCIPGSHRGRYPLPEGIASCDDDPMEVVRHVGMEAGDVLIFLAGAQTHGAFPWRGDEDRRAVFFVYGGPQLQELTGVHRVGAGPGARPGGFRPGSGLLARVARQHVRIGEDAAVRGNHSEVVNSRRGDQDPVGGIPMELAGQVVRPRRYFMGEGNRFRNQPLHRLRDPRLQPPRQSHTPRPGELGEFQRRHGRNKEAVFLGSEVAPRTGPKVSGDSWVQTHTWVSSRKFNLPTPSGRRKSQWMMSPWMVMRPRRLPSSRLRGVSR